MSSPGEQPIAVSSLHGTDNGKFAGASAIEEAAYKETIETFHCISDSATPKSAPDAVIKSLNDAQDRFKAKSKPGSPFAAQVDKDRQGRLQSLFTKFSTEADTAAAGKIKSADELPAQSPARYLLAAVEQREQGKKLQPRHPFRNKESSGGPTA